MEESNEVISVEEARIREETMRAADEIAKNEEAFRLAKETGMSEFERKEKERLEKMGTVSICRMVEYRSRTGNYSVPAVVNCTVASVYQPGVESGNVPALTSADRVHLTVFTPGKPGLRGEADNFVVTSDEEVSENVAGCYQEWNIPFDPDGGPGTWRWPARV